jgi:hypothetical protein
MGKGRLGEEYQQQRSGAHRITLMKMHRGRIFLLELGENESGWPCFNFVTARSASRQRLEVLRSRGLESAAYAACSA